MSRTAPGHLGMTIDNKPEVKPVTQGQKVIMDKQKAGGPGRQEQGRGQSS